MWTRWHHHVDILFPGKGFWDKNLFLELKFQNFFTVIAGICKYLKTNSLETKQSSKT